VQLKLPALEEIDADKIVAGKEYSRKHYECHLPRTDVGDGIDAVDAAGEKKEGEKHDSLIEVEARIQDSEFFFGGALFLRSEETGEPYHRDNEKERGENHEVLLERALADGEQKRNAAHCKKRAQNHRQIFFSGDQKSAEGGKEEQKQHRIRGEAEALEKYVQ